MAPIAKPQQPVTENYHASRITQQKLGTTCFNSLTASIGTGQLQVGGANEMSLLVENSMISVEL